MSLIMWEQPPRGTEAGTIGAVQAQDTTWNNTISTINLIFTALFLLEAALKILALGMVQYLSYSMNIFDLFVVTVSIVGDILERAITHDSVSLVNLLLIF